MSPQRPTPPNARPPDGLPTVEPDMERDSQALDAALDVAAAVISALAVWAAAFVGVPMLMGMLTGR